MKIRILSEPTNCDLFARKNVEAFFSYCYYDIKEFFLSLSCLELHYKSYVFFQNYTLRKLEKHTNYIVTVAARNYVGLGPSAVIELRTEDGGKHIHNVSFKVEKV